MSKNYSFLYPEHANLKDTSYNKIVDRLNIIPYWEEDKTWLINSVEYLIEWVNTQLNSESKYTVSGN